MSFLEWTFYANTLSSWLLALLAFAVAFALLRFGRALVLRSLHHIEARTETHLDNALAEVVRGTGVWFSIAVALWAGSLLLILPERLREIIDSLVIFTFLLQFALWGRAGIHSYVKDFSVRKQDEDGASVTTVRALGFLGTVLLWAVLVLVALDNLGIDITALVAGLGIGGIAVALAVQNVLGDLFASLSIVLDKPFVYGDFIIVDDLMGTVEHVGLKTTRVRSLSGEQLVFSNSDLLNSRIRNYKRMFERRVVFSVGVTYQTPHEKLEWISTMLRDVVEALPEIRFDRAHLKEFGASALNYEIVYYVLNPEFNVYMDRQQAINLEIFRRFQAEEIEFAYPTQTLYVAPGVEGEDGSSSEVRV